MTLQMRLQFCEVMSSYLLNGVFARVLQFGKNLDNSGCITILRSFKRLGSCVRDYQGA